MRIMVGPTDISVSGHVTNIRYNETSIAMISSNHPYLRSTARNATAITLANTPESDVMMKSTGTLG